MSPPRAGEGRHVPNNNEIFSLHVNWDKEISTIRREKDILKLCIEVLSQTLSPCKEVCEKVHAPSQQISLTSDNEKGQWLTCSLFFLTDDTLQKKVSCTACGKQVNQFLRNSVFEHPALKVLICKVEMYRKH